MKKPKTKLFHGSPICAYHNPVDMSYLKWHDWAEKKHKAGERQKRCKDCNHVFYPEEFGERDE